MNRSKPEQSNATNHNVKRIKTLTSVSTPTGPNGADVKQFRVSIRALLPREFDVDFSSELHKVQIVNVLRDNGIPAKIKLPAPSSILSKSIAPMSSFPSPSSSSELEPPSSSLVSSPAKISSTAASLKCCLIAKGLQYHGKKLTHIRHYSLEYLKTCASFSRSSAGSREYVGQSASHLRTWPRSISSARFVLFSVPYKRTPI